VQPIFNSYTVRLNYCLLRPHYCRTKNKLLASASSDETVKVWDVATGSLQQTLEGYSWVVLLARLETAGVSIRQQDGQGLERGYGLAAANAQGL
jgi:WD40 repeat protein